MSSLFHDLGKFYMRTHTEDECKSIKNLRLNHESLLERVKKDIGLDYMDIIDISHENELIDYIKLGDWISAQEREDFDEDFESDEREIRKIPIKSSFSVFDKVKYECLFPSETSLKLPDKEDFEKDFEIHDPNLYKNFCEDIKFFLKKNNIKDIDKARQTIRFFLDIFKKYLVKIASASYYSKPNIDMYNHSRISAAISLCTYRYFKDKNEAKKLKESLKKIFDLKKNENDQEIDVKYKNDEYYNKKIFILIEGDMSGIQDFISTITTEKAMKILNGRSFYISYLSKLVSAKILKELDLPETNLLYCTGGKFLIIAQNEDKVKKIVYDIGLNINEFLFKKFKTKLFLSIELKECSPRDFSFEEENIFAKDGIHLFDKNKKFYEILKKEGFSEKRGLNECKVCKSEIIQQDKCESCEDFEKLRDIIKDYQITKKMKSKINLDIIPFKDEDILYEAYINEIKPIFELIPTGLVLENDKVKELKEIVLISRKNNQEKINKIGALKFDVDNLGYFIRRYENKKDEKIKYSLSLYIRLFFDIELFFHGIISKIWESKYKDKLIIVYSGGDDGFVVGDCFEVLNFAKDVYNYFRIYTGLSENLTLSAVYGIFDQKHPVKKIFENLEEDLKILKQVRKNSISINGNIIRWEYFDDFKESIFDGNYDNPENKDNITDFEFMIKLTNYFVKILKNEKISSSLLYKIFELSDDAISKLESSEKNRKIIPNIYMIKYYLRTLKDEQIKTKIFDLWKNCLMNYNLEEGVENMIYRFRCFKIASTLARMYNKYLKERGENNE